VILLTACGTDPTPTPVPSQGGSPSVPTPTLTEAQAASTPTTGTSIAEANTPSPVATQASDAKACAGISLSSVRLDTMGLPYAWQANCVETTPYDQSQPSGPTGLPQHLEVNFGNVDPKNVKPGDPIIYVIPVAEYEKMWNDNNNPSVSNTLDRFSKLLKDKPEPIPTSGMPVLPYERVIGHNDLSVQGNNLIL
jgi:cytoskeletal protein RodZ